MLRWGNKCPDMVVYTLHRLKCTLQHQMCISLFLNLLNYIQNNSLLLPPLFIRPVNPDTADNHCFTLVFVE